VEGNTEWPAARSDLLVFVAFSGGGKRSAAFAHGALRGLRAIPVRPPTGGGWRMLDDVDYISGVSGGSFPAAHYGLYRERHFETFEQDFLKRDIDAFIYGIYLFPWNWDWLANPLVGTNDYMAQVYDRLMFRGATFADLRRRGPPVISVNATDITNEVSFPFTGGSFGALCSHLDSFPIARAVAASNGFPILFSPITIESYAARCGGRRPPGVPPASLTSRRAELARVVNVYQDPQQTRFVHLMDGGIADNLALRGLLDVFIGLDSGDALYRTAARRHGARGASWCSAWTANPLPTDRSAAAAWSAASARSSVRSAARRSMPTTSRRWRSRPTRLPIWCRNFAACAAPRDAW
jgi:NTE family protein